MKNSQESSIDSFLMMEKIANDDLIGQKLNLEAKYCLKNVGIVDKHAKENSTDILYSNGTKEYIMANGMRKRVYEDGLIIIQLPNKDIKVVSKSYN